ncbi:hypothetical protein, partial [Streptococcus suis]|uniref:hypothetical protein n=7 Tax=Streptococcus suis TaxID=1307 RepID=UPI003B3BA18D
MRKFFQDLNQEYLETRSSVGEDWLEWIIQRKMTWGMRWGLVEILMFVLQPLTYNPHFLLGCFYIGFLLGLVYVCGQLFFYHLSSLSRYLMKNILSSIVKIRKLFSFGLKFRVKKSTRNE